MRKKLIAGAAVCGVALLFAVQGTQAEAAIKITENKLEVKNNMTEEKSLVLEGYLKAEPTYDEQGNVRLWVEGLNSLTEAPVPAVLKNEVIFNFEQAKLTDETKMLTRNIHIPQVGDRVRVILSENPITTFSLPPIVPGVSIKSVIINAGDIAPWENTNEISE